MPLPKSRISRAAPILKPSAKIAGPSGPMNFIIIGESANQIPEEIDEQHSEIPWNLMRAMRNRIVHTYFRVDETLLWDTIQNDLPALIPKLEKLLH
jgi:uncharacterized protein with HEPN domain